MLADNYNMTASESTGYKMNNKVGQTGSHQTFVYPVYMFLSCLLTAELNVIHTKFLLGVELTVISFLMPTAAGMLFGYTLARIKALSNQMAEMAYTDSLTEIYNRLHFNNFLRAEIDKVKRYGGNCSIIFLDIDQFKQINDSHGHSAGDEILKELSSIVSSANRSTDIFARYGGEEFIIMAASTNIDGAFDHAQRLQQDIEQRQFSTGQVTCSFGVTEFIPETDTLASLIKRVDEALYDAKAEGRNCVVKR